jgi:hypothetical protein
MRKTIWVAAFGAALVAGSALAQAQGPRNVPGQRAGFRVLLDGYQEVPAVSSEARGHAVLHVSPRGGSLDYEVAYEGLEGNVLQAHIHLGRPGTNGGIMVFLCSNLGNGPAGTPVCPGPRSGSVSGSVDAAGVVGPSGQGIAAGEFAEVLAGIRSRSAYVNVHSDLFPGGEIRGNIR